VTTTLIHPASFVDERAQLGEGVTIGPGAVVGPDVKVGDGTSIGGHALLTGWTSVGRECRIHHGAVLGSPPQDLKFRGEKTFLEVGDHTEVREYVTANVATEEGATTRVGSHCLLMAYAHVAHNCQIGNHVVVANVVQFAGYVTVDDWAIVGGGSLIHQFVRIGRHSMIGGGSRISQDILPFVKAAGSPPRLAGINAIGLERRRFPNATIEAIDRAYKIVFRSGLTVPQAVEQMRAEFPGSPEIEHVARFAETSVRGLTR
jgi:UDP-N-acetylglucosamine acyltransferase